MLSIQSQSKLGEARYSLTPLDLKKQQLKSSYKYYVNSQNLFTIERNNNK